MSDPADSRDVIVVGAGIAGAWAAKELTEAGLTVALLDAGPDIEASPYNVDSVSKAERARLALRRQRIQSLHLGFWAHDPQLFVDDILHPYVSDGPDPFVWIRGRQVGGRSLTWGGITLRLSDEELLAPQTDGFGPRWPLTYLDLAPFYDQAERFLGIHGQIDAVPQLPDGVFNSPVPLTGAEAFFKRAIEHRWPERRVLHGRGMPENSDGDARWQPRAIQHKILPASLRTGRAVVRPDCIVSRLILSERGDRVTAVECIDRRTHQRYQLRSRSFALCASTIETVRLLLNSRTDREPYGIANSSGCLGRFIVDHMGVVLSGVIPGELPEPAPTFGSAHGIVIPRFRNITEPTREFIRGYGITGTIGRNLWQDGTSAWSLSAMLEVLPRAENRIQIDADKADAWGIAASRITLSYSDNELRMREDALRCMREMSEYVGWRALRETELRPGQFVHELGGARMGHDPATSILNSKSQSWDLPNLFVLDGSSFVTSGWQNPTLTIMALAIRGSRSIAEYLASNG
jgi:choline dehydrogenase-like flavoprotein